MNEPSEQQELVVALAREAGVEFAVERVGMVAETLAAFRPLLASFAPIVTDEDRPLCSVEPESRP